MDYLGFVVLVIPAVIGLLAALAWGPGRGTWVGGVAMLIVVFVLLLFQVSVPATGPGAEYSRFHYAWGLMRFEWYRWLSAFMIGMAIGLLIFRRRISGASDA